MANPEVRYALGDRVAIRTRIVDADGLPPSSGPRLTDTVGDVVAQTAAHVVVRTRRGDVELPRGLIVAARVIPPRPARRGAAHRAISREDLQRVMSAGQPGLEEHRLGDGEQGWLLRAGRGWTGRSNSVLPAGDPGLPMEAALTAVEEWYTERGLRPLVMLPYPAAGDPREDPLTRLAERRGYRATTPVAVLTAATPQVLASGLPHEAPVVTSTPSATSEWLGGGGARLAAHLETAREVLAIPRDQDFLTVHEGGRVVGVARAAHGAGWSGLFGVHVDPDARRRGLGRALTVAAARAASSRGIASMYLQVETTNAAALRLYGALGFAEHHRYVYLAGPDTAR